MGDERLLAANPARRYAAVGLFLGTWIACGWLLRLDTNTYLLLGVPLTLLFQWGVRRRPLRALWVREAPPLRLGWNGAAIAATLSLIPLASLVDAVAEGEWVGGLFSLVSVAGAVGAAYAARHFRREHLRPLAWCLLITLSLDALQWSVFLGTGLVEPRWADGGVAEHVGVGVLSLLQYAAVVFALEEVTFRMLDSHLHESDRGRGIPSAVLLAAAWGLWHLPGGEELTGEAVGILLYVHVPYGVALALFWRKTGNLAVPALCHALGDAIRNGIMAGE